MLIAQVTDIHAAPDNNHLSRLERVLSWLNSFQADMLVLTGDLTDGYWPEGYAQIASMLTAQPYPSLLLPGNADNRDLMRQQWGNERWVHDVSGQSLHFSQSGAGLHLLGLDTSVSEQSYGDVTGHLEWLDNQLDAAGDAPVLLFLHHHVFPTGISTLDETMCRGLSEFRKVLRRTPARRPATFTALSQAPLPASRPVSVVQSARQTHSGLVQITSQLRLNPRC